MNREQLLDWVRTQYGTQPEYLWPDSPDSAVLRGGNGKWYGIFMRVSRARLGLSGPGDADILNVKCDPALVDALRTQPGFLPAYHMNKRHWISILLDGTVPEEDLLDLLSASHRITIPKNKLRPRAERET